MPSKLFTRAKNDSLEAIFRNDTYRYVRNGFSLTHSSNLSSLGFGLVIGISINVFFFFIFPQLLTAFWPYFLSLGTEAQLIFWTTISLHSGIYLFATLGMYLISQKKWAVFEKDRISPHVPWPWEHDPEAWKRMRNRSFWLLLDHHLILTPLALAIDNYISGVYWRFDSETFPSYKEIIFQVILFMISDDFFFYWGHRLLHHPKIYPHIHKLHHEHYNPLVFSAEYDHPFEFLIGTLSQNLMPRMLGLRCHYMTCIMWLFVRTFEVLDDHCGYEFSWSPFRLVPFSGSASYHNFHHTHNDGNYATFFTLWDTLNGTNKPFYEFINKKEKNQVQFFFYILVLLISKLFIKKMLER